ncbi:MAG: peptidase C69, partial [Calditrichales bacterium]
MRSTVYVIFTILLISTLSLGQTQRDLPDWEDGFPDGCTSITVGSKASFDGSVMTSHTCDSHRTRGWLTVSPKQIFKKGSTVTMVKRVNEDSLAMPSYKYIATGEIPQVEKTYGFINTAYPCINDQQLAIGESTFGGRETLLSESGLIDCQQLVRLMLERCTTARQAIRLAGDLTGKYGWNDSGECLTIADTKEVWHLEIVGPGKGHTGSVWVAQRVPDDHISVNANASRIRHIDLDDDDYFMASDNIFTVAQDSGWWNPDDGPFEFCYAYSPESRTSLAGRRREWRVLSLAAPSLNLDAESENYPFSVKPDTLVGLPKMVSMFQDYYENTPYNFVKDLTWTNEAGETGISPLANPFMPYDMNKLFKINGGWGWRGERTIARW